MPDGPSAWNTHDHDTLIEVKTLLQEALKELKAQRDLYANYEQRLRKVETDQSNDRIAIKIWGTVAGFVITAIASSISTYLSHRL